MNKYLKMALGAIAGGTAGFAWYYYFGCNGSCPLTSTWFIPTFYGIGTGLVLLLPGKKREQKNV